MCAQHAARAHLRAPQWPYQRPDRPRGSQQSRGMRGGATRPALLLEPQNALPGQKTMSTPPEFCQRSGRTRAQFVRREVAPSWCSPSRAAARAHLPWETQAHPACMAWGAPVLRSPARTRAAPSGRPEAPRRGPARPSGADPGIFAAWPALASPAQPDALAAHLGCHGPLRLGLSFRAAVSRGASSFKNHIVNSNLQCERKGLPTTMAMPRT